MKDKLSSAWRSGGLFILVSCLTGSSVEMDGGELHSVIFRRKECVMMWRRSHHRCDTVKAQFASDQELILPPRRLISAVDQLEEAEGKPGIIGNSSFSSATDDRMRLITDEQTTALNESYKLGSLNLWFELTTLKPSSSKWKGIDLNWNTGDGSLRRHLSHLEILLWIQTIHNGVAKVSEDLRWELKSRPLSIITHKNLSNFDFGAAFYLFSPSCENLTQASITNIQRRRRGKRPGCDLPSSTSSLDMMATHFSHTMRISAR